MRARPKQANYLQKFKEAEPARKEYGENGRRLTTTSIRDSSPVQTSGGPSNRSRAGPAGISNVSSKGAGKGASASSSSSTIATMGNASAKSSSGGGGGGGGGDIKQYIDLDDVPDGLPLSPRWMSKKTIIYYQGDDNPPDDNYWAPSSSSKAATHAALGPLSAPAPATRRAPPPRAIPKQAFQPMRPHLHDEDGDGGDGGAEEYEYRREYKDDGRSERDDEGYRDSRGNRRRGDSRGDSRRTQFDDDYGDQGGAAQSKAAPRRATSGAAYRDTSEAQDAKNYGSSRKAQGRSYDDDDDDDDDEEWGDDSLRRDSPPSDRYERYDSYESAHLGGGYSKSPPVSTHRDAPAPRQSDAPSSKRSPAPPRPPAPLHIQPQAPSLPCEMKHAPPLPSSDFTPAEQLYFSRQPRSVEYRPYTLEQYRMIKPKDYVEIANIRPDLNSDVLVAKRANQERIKEFSKNLLEFNQRALRQQRKLPQSAESNSITLAQKKILSKRERALEFSRNVPRPKPAAAGASQRSSPSRRSPGHGGHAAGDDEADWAGKEFEHDYMQESHGMNEVEFRRLETLEQKHNDSQRQIAAIKKSLNL